MHAEHIGELFIVFLNVFNVVAVLDFLYIGLLFCIWLLKPMLFPLGCARGDNYIFCTSVLS